MRIDEQVFRLEVSVDEIERVEIFEREYNLSGVKPRVRLTNTHTAENITLSRWCHFDRASTGGRVGLYISF